MKTEKRNFDQVAENWDEKPVRVKLATDVAQSIIQEGMFTPQMDIMDFGCGTGLLMMQVQPLVRSITGVDSSQGMLDQLNNKIAKQKITNIKTHLVDIEAGDTLEGEYDLILSNMTIHHVKDIQSLLDTFHKILKPNGMLCLSDLDPEKGNFHSDNTGVFHFGIDRKVLRQMYEIAGFTEIRDKTAAEVEKPGTGGEMNHFTIFLMLGRKK